MLKRGLECAESKHSSLLTILAVINTRIMLCGKTFVNMKWLFNQGLQEANIQPFFDGHRFYISQEKLYVLTDLKPCLQNIRLMKLSIRL
jgi:hypothetical protein